MSKDVIISGIVVVLCMGLVVIAFTMGSPPNRSPSPGPLAQNDDFGVPPPGTSPGFSIDRTPPPLDPFGNPGTPVAPAPLPQNDFGSFPPATVPGTAPGGFPLDPIPTVAPAPVAAPIPTFGVPPVVPVVPAVEATANAATAATTHTIAKGETLGDISTHYYKTSKLWKKIADANPSIDPSRLHVGTVLNIPGADSGGAADRAPSTAQGTTYKVQKGDSYYSIAGRQLGDKGRWKELEQLNKIPAEELLPGMTIKLPSKDHGKVAGADLWVVRAGDTLGEISQQHYGTTQQWQAIAEANPGINPEDLKVGQRLHLPKVEVSNVHVVAKGDTLGEISQQHYGTSKKWQDIVKANPGLDPEGLKVGQKLIIPGKTKVAAEHAHSAAAAAAGDYVVEKGDTFGTIAAKLLGSAQRAKDIADANPGAESSKLRVGQRLTIPARSSGVGNGSATQANPGGAPLLGGPPAGPGTLVVPPKPEIIVPPEDLFEPIPVVAPRSAQAPAPAGFSLQ